jgi:YD repeat-containing protein
MPSALRDEGNTGTAPTAPFSGPLQNSCDSPAAADPPVGYDGSGLQRFNNRTLHDDATYGSSALYRGNPTTTVSFNTTTLVYDTAGVVYKVTDGSGKTTKVTSAPSNGYSLTAQLMPGDGNANLTTSVSYASSWGVTSVSSPNGEASTTTYDGFGRPFQTTLVDGATIGYAYTANTQTATQTQPLPLTGNRYKPPLWTASGAL